MPDFVCLWLKKAIESLNWSFDLAAAFIGIAALYLTTHLWTLDRRSPYEITAFSKQLEASLQLCESLNKLCAPVFKFIKNQVRENNFSNYEREKFRDVIENDILSFRLALQLWEALLPLEIIAPMYQALNTIRAIAPSSEEDGTALRDSITIDNAYSLLVNKQKVVFQSIDRVFKIQESATAHNDS